jgi:hypothetical protein
MKIGDKVKMSYNNSNHLGNDVCAYAGMEGLVTDIYDDGSFVLNCDRSILVVPMNNAFNKPEGVWIFLNGEHIFHKNNTKTGDKVRMSIRSSKKWYQKLFN